MIIFLLLYMFFVINLIVPFEYCIGPQVINSLLRPCINSAYS